MKRLKTFLTILTVHGLAFFSLFPPSLYHAVMTGLWASLVVTVIDCHQDSHQLSFFWACLVLYCLQIHTVYGLQQSEILRVIEASLSYGD